MTEIGLENEDWLRTASWDIWKTDYSAKVETLDELRQALGYYNQPDAQWRERLRNLADLPFWQAAPQRLKDETDRFLAAD
jgi:hypothetical protein